MIETSRYTKRDVKGTKRECESGAKKPQLRQDHSRVVTRTAHHRMQCIAHGTFERVAPEPAIHQREA